MKRPTGARNRPDRPNPSHEWSMAKADRHHSMGRTISLADARALLARTYQSIGLVEKKLLKALEEGRVHESRIREDGTRVEGDAAWWRSEVPGYATKLYVNWSENSARHGYLVMFSGDGRKYPALPEPAYAIMLSLDDVLALLPTVADAAGEVGRRSGRRGREREYAYEPIQEVARDAIKRGVDDLKSTFFDRVRHECGERRPRIRTPDDDRTMGRIVGAIYDAAKARADADSRRNSTKA
jgi:hypothetical protein